MGEHNNQIQIDKVAVQRLLDAARILREVASQEDIDRINSKLVNDRIQIDERRVPPSPGVRHFFIL